MNYQLFYLGEFFLHFLRYNKKIRRLFLKLILFALIVPITLFAADICNCKRATAIPLGASKCTCEGQKCTISCQCASAEIPGTGGNTQACKAKAKPGYGMDNKLNGICKSQLGVFQCVTSNIPNIQCRDYSICVSN